MRLLAQLHALQERHGYLREEDLRTLSREARVPLYRLQGLVSYYPHFRVTPPPKVHISVCRDMCCWLAGGPETCRRVRDRWAGQGDVAIQDVSCLGRCDAAPAVAVNDVPVPAAEVASAGSISALAALSSSAQGNRPTQRQWRCDRYAIPAEHYATIREFVTGDREQAAERVLAALKASGLRGMGGAGFPTGAKWALVREQSRNPKYVICNADESEPGTFKDRVVLSELPHLVLEGMILAGLVVGASKGIVFIRHEYGPERHALEKALAAAREAGLVGRDILGSGFDFEIEVFVSPGGYILGEETALLEALEDKRGEPRNKPPFPGTHGLHGQPTLINNVETLAMVPSIVRQGAEWWKAQGKPGFAGLKLMAVSGHVERPGVYEIGFGTTVRELIVEAGGVADGKKLLAFAPGGASSALLPASMADVPLDFDAMAKAGSMLGSGALVVVAEGTDLLALAANITRFFRNESCGKCVPCRLGTQKAVDLMDSVRESKADSSALDVLPELAETMTLTSICGLGQAALNSVLSVLKHWPDGTGTRTSAAQQLADHNAGAGP